MLIAITLGIIDKLRTLSCTAMAKLWERHPMISANNGLSAFAESDITDEYSYWPAKCSKCGAPMQVLRPGDARCSDECYLKDK
jgi:hypothetical protein